MWEFPLQIWNILTPSCPHVKPHQFQGLIKISIYTILLYLPLLKNETYLSDIQISSYCWLLHFMSLKSSRTICASLSQDDDPKCLEGNSKQVHDIWFYSMRHLSLQYTHWHRDRKKRAPAINWQWCEEEEEEKKKTLVSQSHCRGDGYVGGWGLQINVCLL